MIYAHRHICIYINIYIMYLPYNIIHTYTEANTLQIIYIQTYKHYTCIDI